MDPRLAQQLLDMHQSGQLVLHPNNVQRLQNIIYPGTTSQASPADKKQAQDIQQGIMEANKAPVQIELNAPAPSQNQDMFDKYPNNQAPSKSEQLYNDWITSLYNRKKK